MPTQPIRKFKCCGSWFVHGETRDTFQCPTCHAIYHWNGFNVALGPKPGPQPFSYSKTGEIVYDDDPNFDAKINENREDSDRISDRFPPENRTESDTKSTQNPTKSWLILKGF